MIKSEIPFKAYLKLLKLENGQTEIVVQGPKKLFDLVNHLKQEHGVDPQKWPLQIEKNSESFIVNEFIQKVNNEYSVCYKHDELCHCRSVATNKVLSCIKDGDLTLADISRHTMAGTGCGSCHKDIEALISQVLNQK